MTPWRQKQKEKALKRLESSEQYALVAGQNGWYPCYKCPDTAAIFLLVDEVWKYGATTKQEKGHYMQGLPDSRLVYVIQFEGTFQECREMELIKIYDYPLLPENAKRNPPILLPPGNFRSD